MGNLWQVVEQSGRRARTVRFRHEAGDTEERRLWVGRMDDSDATVQIVNDDYELDARVDGAIRQRFE